MDGRVWLKVEKEKPNTEVLALRGVGRWMLGSSNRDLFCNVSTVVLEGRSRKRKWALFIGTL